MCNDLKDLDNTIDLERRPSHKRHNPSQHEKNSYSLIQRMSVKEDDCRHVTSTTTIITHVYATTLLNMKNSLSLSDTVWRMSVDCL